MAEFQDIEPSSVIMYRDGQHKGNTAHRKTLQTRKRSESCKLSSEPFCLASITAREYLHSGKVTVNYTAAHTNHHLDLEECKHLPLPLSTPTWAVYVCHALYSKNICSLQQSEVRQEVVWAESISKTLLPGSICIIWQDCCNIGKKLKEFSTHCHNEDAISVDRIVRELHQESSFLPVLAYKPTRGYWQMYSPTRWHLLPSSDDKVSIQAFWGVLGSSGMFGLHSQNKPVQA